MTEKAGVTEQYTSAANTTNLTVVAEKRGAGDVLMAAGMVRQQPNKRLGMAVMRLLSEIEGAQRRHGTSRIDIALLAAKMRTLPEVIERLATYVAEDAEKKARCSILWWLDSNCKRCTGRLFETIPGTPSLSAIACRDCKGLGKITLPYGSEGKMLVDAIETSVYSARETMKRRLHTFH